MSELKPCPFCGKQPAAQCSSAICINDDCELSDYWRGLEDDSWNTRPIEDALNKRIAELEANNDRLQDTWFVEETICPDGSLKPKASALLSRIAELEGLVDELIEAGESMSLAVECGNQIEANAYYSWKELVKDWEERER